MPYRYYQFVRFAELVGFAILAYQANKECRQNEMIIYVVFALLFQPFVKIALGKVFPKAGLSGFDLSAPP